MCTCSTYLAHTCRFRWLGPAHAAAHSCVCMCLCARVVCLSAVQQMMMYTPAKRITAKAACIHPYFNDLDTSGLDL